MASGSVICCASRRPRGELQHGDGAVDDAEQAALGFTDKVCVSSRLRRVAASISMIAPAVKRTGGEIRGNLPFCVST